METESRTSVRIDDHNTVNRVGELSRDNALTNELFRRSADTKAGPRCRFAEAAGLKGTLPSLGVVSRNSADARAPPPDRQ